MLDRPSPIVSGADLKKLCPLLKTSLAEKGLQRSVSYVYEKGRWSHQKHYLRVSIGHHPSPEEIAQARSTSLSFGKYEEHRVDGGLVFDFSSLNLDACSVHLSRGDRQTANTILTQVAANYQNITALLKRPISRAEDSRLDEDLKTYSETLYHPEEEPRFISAHQNDKGISEMPLSEAILLYRWLRAEARGAVPYQYGDAPIMMADKVFSALLNWSNGFPPKPVPERDVYMTNLPMLIGMSAQLANFIIEYPYPVPSWPLEWASCEERKECRENIGNILTVTRGHESLLSRCAHAMLYEKACQDMQRVRL